MTSRRKPTLQQRQILTSLHLGQRLTGHIRWRTGGRRYWQLWTVRISKFDGQEVWENPKHVRDPQVAALLKHRWITKVPTRKTAVKEVVITPAGRAAIQVPDS